MAAQSPVSMAGVDSTAQQGHHHHQQAQLQQQQQGPQPQQQSVIHNRPQQQPSPYEKVDSINSKGDAGFWFGIFHFKEFVRQKCYVWNAKENFGTYLYNNGNLLVNFCLSSLLPLPPSRSVNFFFDFRLLRKMSNSGRMFSATCNNWVSNWNTFNCHNSSNHYSQKVNFSADF